VTAKTDRRQVQLLPPDAAALVHLVRENLRLLAELVSRYEIDRLVPTIDGPAFRKPADVADYLGPELSELAQEQLRVVCLNLKSHVLVTQIVYQGGLNATVVRIADCFREAVRIGADAIVLVHNHPSGDPTPSPEDVRLTAEVGHAGDLLGIDVLDHVIVSRGGYVSLRERGLYTPASGRAAEPTG